jgi:hypothetical protein
MSNREWFYIQQEKKDQVFTKHGGVPMFPVNDKEGANADDQDDKIRGNEDS